MNILDLLQGFVIGSSLIIAIGPQNLFVINQGIKRKYILITVLICSLSDAILYLLDNPQIRKKMGQIGQQLISQTYNWSTISDSYIDLYADILRSKYE